MDGNQEIIIVDENNKQGINTKIKLDNNYKQNIKNLIKGLIKNGYIDPLRMINNEGILTTDYFETFPKLEERRKNVQVLEKLDEILGFSEFAKNKNKIRILILTLKNSNKNKKIKLVINLDNFYLQGFINNQNQYFYFKEEKTLDQWNKEIENLEIWLNEWNILKVELNDLSLNDENKNKIKEIDKNKVNWKKQLSNDKQNTKIIELININDFATIETNYEIPKTIEVVKEFWDTYKKIQKIRQTAINLLKKQKAKFNKNNKEYEKYMDFIKTYQWDKFNEISKIIAGNIDTIQHKKIKENKINEIVLQEYSINPNQICKLDYNCSYQEKGLNAIKQNIIISLDNLNKAIENIADINNVKELNIQKEQDRKNDLVRVIFITNEAMRFGSHIKYFYNYEKDGKLVEFKNIPEVIQNIINNSQNESPIFWKEYQNQLIGGWEKSSKYVESEKFGKKKIFKDLSLVIESNIFLGEKKEEINMILENLFENIKNDGENIYISKDEVEEAENKFEDKINNPPKNYQFLEELKDLNLKNFKELINKNNSRIKDIKDTGKLAITVTEKNFVPGIFRSIIINDNNDLVELLLMKKPELLESKDSCKWTALHLASGTWRMKSVEIMINEAKEIYKNEPQKFKNFINAKDKYNSTPLHSVTNKSEMKKNEESKNYQDYTKVVKLLLDNGANPNNQNSDGNTPLHLAAMGINLNMVKLLLENGADIDFLNKENKKPIDYAGYQGEIYNEEIYNMLYDKYLTSTNHYSKTFSGLRDYFQKQSALELNEQSFNNIGMKYVLNIKNELEPKYNAKKCESILVSKLKNENKYDLLNKAQTGLENNENLTPYEIESKNEWIQKTKNKIKENYQNFMKSKKITPDILKKELIIDKNKISNLNIQEINRQEQFDEPQPSTSRYRPSSPQI